ncbi:NAD+ diphosphatase [Pholiota molesta]|nr:NAD+ diphosphatase [Pholiota molesta]
MPERHVNMYGGSPLNRLSWLRPSQIFLNAVAALPQTRWILFSAGQPLTATESASAKPFPAYLSTEDVKPLLGPGPYFGQGKEAGELVVEKGPAEEHGHDHSPTEGARHLGARAVFLGLHENQSGHNSTAISSSELSNIEQVVKKLDGIPYFAMDVMDLKESPEELLEILKDASLGREGKILSWSEPRSFLSSMDVITAGIYAPARSMVDWNQRTKFCAGCGSPTYSMWGGWKVSCTSLLPWVDNNNGKPCPTAKGLHNFTHPRTDPVVIMIAIDETGDKILLGRGKRYPDKFYSALAGFVEPGETFEDAVAREMWEEAGIHVWNMTYHSGQPWPYPANLMVGFYARGDSTKPIRTDLDNELVDARWFTRAEVEAVLNNTAGTKFGNTPRVWSNETTEANNKDPTKLDAAGQASTTVDPTKAKPQAVPQDDGPPFRLPPTSAIAGVLIRDWVDRKIGFPAEEVVQKGNL